MRAVLLIVLLSAAFEAVWHLSHTLRPHRHHFRLQIALFWLLVLAIYYGSTWRIFPDAFHYGHGVLRFASDAENYHAYAARIAADLRQGRFVQLLDHQQFFYSKALAFVYLVFGSSPLVGMLINVVPYMTTIVCVFLFSQALYGERVAKIAIWFVALWPTFLLHETQTLKWVVTTAGLHLMIASLTLVVTGAPFLPAMLASLIGFVPVVTDLPYNAYGFYMTLGVLTVMLGTIGLWRRSLLKLALRLGAATAIFFLAYSSLWMSPSAPSETHVRKGAADAVPEALPPSQESVELVSERPSTFGWLKYALDRRVNQVLLARQGALSVEYVRSPATLVPDTRPILNTADFFRYLPYAYRNALIQPTPAMLAADQAGVSAGRAYVIPEMLMYYSLLPFIGVAFILSVWPMNQSGAPAVLLLLFFTVLMYGLLGTVVVNGGTLFRLRLPLFLLQLPLALEGVRVVVARWHAVSWRAC